ncbi:Microspherule protein 1 [Araneus ventricosus]|uniref:Microspherule protein 1 n=1 Tax=Araneus ventricosus TaxID=182803 RepID=A0A4Y2DT36_ARAVE|nr:Microspherule protein 1 [Araneus ventricosus]
MNTYPFPTHNFPAKIAGVSLPEFDSKTLAVLKGRIVRYLIQSREVTFGRSAKDNNVDIDLSLEGPSWKISRRQGVIKMDTNGDFYIINEGKKPIFIDGKPVLTGNKYKLSNNSVIEIAVLRFVFIVNLEAIAALRSKGPG